MTIKLSEIMGKLPKERRDKIEARTTELIVEHIKFRDVKNS
ncbi:MAG: hypothetical protein AAGG00_03935 [Cyanobacteria bacterium P01_H01_bin.150]